MGGQTTGAVLPDMIAPQADLSVGDKHHSTELHVIFDFSSTHVSDSLLNSKVYLEPTCHLEVANLVWPWQQLASSNQGKQENSTGLLWKWKSKQVSPLKIIIPQICMQSQPITQPHYAVNPTHTHLCPCIQSLLPHMKLCIHSRH